MRRAFEIGTLASLLVLLSHCSARPTVSPRDSADAADTGAKLPGANADERALLAGLPGLRSGKAQRVRDLSVLADEPYEAASGRQCRALQVQAVGGTHNARRLACSDGSGWFFVPDVFGSSAGE